MGRYTLVFEWPDGEEPAVGAGDTFKDGKLCEVSFFDWNDKLSAAIEDEREDSELWRDR